MNPLSIAVVGASRNRAKFGNKCVRAYLEAGYQVFPVNPHEAEIEGLPVYPALGSIPVEPDRISIYLPPEKTLSLLPQLEALGESQIWFNPGSATADILEAARAAGLEARDGCSIVDIGLSPAQFPG